MRLSGAVGTFSDSRHVKPGIEAICWSRLGEPGYRPGEKKAAAAV